jgi:hypothetical protein
MRDSTPATNVAEKTALAAARLEQDDFSSIRHPALAFCWSMFFFRKPVSTPDQSPGQVFSG